jgi:uncharacterized cupredoxin-like copper-binding protein
VQKLVVTLAVAGLTGLVGVAPAGARQTSDTDAFCQARIDAEEEFGKLFESDEPDPDVVDAVNELLDELDQLAPPDIAAQVPTVTGALRQALETGFESDPFEDPVVDQAGGEIDAFVNANCGFEIVDVTGVEYAFEGIPKSVPAGVVAFNFTNDGAEVHEIVIFRLKGDESLKKILSLPEKKLEKKVVFINATGVPPGESADTIYADLKPGRYGAVCHIPVGTTDESQLEDEQQDEDAPTHDEEGMYQEFKVKKA